VNEDCLKLTAYFSERGRAEGRFLADVMLDLFGDREIATSVLMRGIEGFGYKHHLRTDRLLTLSEDLPLVAVAVDERPRIESVLADLTKVDHRALSPSSGRGCCAARSARSPFRKSCTRRPN
jgi:PII-like signaling protein